MALVGPRPLPTEYVSRYTASEARRLDVRPGITGWAQVNGRNAIGWDERLAMDVWYVENRTLRLDIRILFRTVRVVVRQAGVDLSRTETMPPFRPEQRNVGR
jgi:lipopolysaccharide/colanic/teichoic acid biosynthesis glycosyltransferase